MHFSDSSLAIYAEGIYGAKEKISSGVLFGIGRTGTNQLISKRCCLQITN